MPKYYRFRAQTPTRKPKRGKDKEKHKEFEMVDAGRNWLTLTCSPTPSWSWYLRRTSWRQSPPAMGLPRQLSTALRASLNNRPVLVVKIPASEFLRI